MLIVLSSSPRDAFYDDESAMKDADQEKKLKQKPKRSAFLSLLVCDLARIGLSHLAAYVKRVIAHPAFHNVSFEQAVQLLANMDLGECIIRPSSKVCEFTVRWM